MYEKKRAFAYLHTQKSKRWTYVILQILWLKLDLVKHSPPLYWLWVLAYICFEHSIWLKMLKFLLMANHQFPMINFIFNWLITLILSYFFQLAFSRFWHWSQIFFSMFRLNLFLFFFHSPLEVILIQGWQYWPTASCHLSQYNFYIFKYGVDKINVSLFAPVNIFDLMNVDMFAFVVNSS